MNVLLVDDDRFVVAALKKGINWESLGFDNIYMAYDMESAKSVMLSNSINLLLSDIDMPHGNGLELLEWVRSKFNNIPCIFLTNYADFDYAQQAVSLHCFHYFLKPIDYGKLTEIIKQAVNQINEQSLYQVEKYVSYFANYALKGKTNDAKCPYANDAKLLPFVIQLYPHFLKSDKTLCSHLESNPLLYLQTTYDAYITPSTEGSFLIEDIHEEGRYFGILALSELDYLSDLQASFEEMLSDITRRLHCPANIYLADICTPADFSTSAALLKQVIRNHLGSSGHVVSCGTFIMPKENYEPANIDEIYALLEAEDFDKLTTYCQEYLLTLIESHSLSYRALGAFQVDIIQALYTYLRKKGLLAKKLYFGEPYHTIAAWACKSSADMALYLQYIFSIAEENLTISSSEKSVAEIIKEYVDSHYAEDIGRQSLESILYFDPDYASRLFKKETGYSFMNYVIQKRISEAQKLLKNTDLSISQISATVGYDNYSYFTRLFKKETGLTPIEYRLAEKK